MIVVLVPTCVNPAPAPASAAQVSAMIRSGSMHYVPGKCGVQHERAMSLDVGLLVHTERMNRRRGCTGLFPLRAWMEGGYHFAKVRHWTYRSGLMQPRSVYRRWGSEPIQRPATRKGRHVAGWFLLDRTRSWRIQCSTSQYGARR
jgi:hypothetical protein